MDFNGVAFCHGPGACMFLLQLYTVVAASFSHLGPHLYCGLTRSAHPNEKKMSSLPLIICSQVESFDFVSPGFERFFSTSNTKKVDRILSALSTFKAHV